MGDCASKFNKKRKIETQSSGGAGDADPTNETAPWLVEKSASVSNAIARPVVPVLRQTSKHGKDKPRPAPVEPTGKIAPWLVSKSATASNAKASEPGKGKPKPTAAARTNEAAPWLASTSAPVSNPTS